MCGRLSPAANTKEKQGINVKRKTCNTVRKYNCPIREVQKSLRPDTGKKIRELRKSCNYTQQTLANLIGVSRSAISNWETFERTPGIKHYASLARVFGVSVFSLAGKDKE